MIALLAWPASLLAWPASLLAWPASLLVAGVLATRRTERRARGDEARRAELVARACHEIRGPLTAAGLALHLLARRGVPVADVEAELRRAAHALADLGMAPAGRRAVDVPEAVDVDALLAAQAARWQGAAAVHGSELVLGERAAGAVVRADRLRLSQAFANLVANALEHGGPRVQVGIRAVGQVVQVEIADDGPGLPAPLAVLVARPRGGRGARGRGLAIATDIVTRHGGRLATAPSARGARLVLELPAWPVPAESSGETHR